MECSRRRVLHLLSSAGVASVAGCQSDTELTRGSLRIAIENRDTEEHTLWVNVIDADENTIDRLNMVSVPAGDSFEFETERYLSESYTIRLEVDQSETQTYEWTRERCKEWIDLFVTIDTDGQPQVDPSCN